METNQNENAMKKQLNTWRILTAIFAVIAIVMAILYFTTNSELKQVTIVKNEVTDEKTELLDKLQKVEKQYDQLGKDYSNLDSLFTKEKEHVAKMISEIKNQKGSMANYKKKVANLETRLQEYLEQIKELKDKNEALTTENLKVKTALDSTTTVAANLSSQNQNLSSKVEAGSALKAYEMAAEPIKMRGTKEISTKNPKRVKKVRVCFLLSENAIAQAGSKTVYIRISEPGGEVIADAKDDSHMFTFEGKQIVYTQMQEINYQNKAMDLCIYYDVKKELKKGSYTVDIFVDKAIIGTTLFTLE
ncbi:MAG: hypothetical protein WCH34_11415 [Bacteroidota bacterium]